MKQFSIAVAVLICIVACNSSSSTGDRPKVIKADSVQVLALYRSAYKNEIISGFLIRVTVDSFMYVNVDSVTRVKKWGIDTSYVASYPTVVDSALAKQYRVPLKDSTGKPTIINLIVTMDKKFVRSGWNRADTSTVKEMLSIK